MPNHALQRTRPERRGLQSLRPVRRVGKLGSLGVRNHLQHSVLQTIP